jgi:hydroxymethylbilane synthase
LGWLAAIDDSVAHAVLDEERGFLSRLGSGCDLPVGAYATVTEGVMSLEGLLASPDGRVLVRHHQSAPLDALGGLGRSVAEYLLASGGSALIDPEGP